MTNKQKIEMNKEYTSNGKKVRILCTDRNCNQYPVVALIDGVQVEHFTEYGQLHHLNPLPQHDLVEYSPWQDVAVDTKVICAISEDSIGFNYYKRHFAKYEDGEVFVFADGQSSFTTNCGVISFPYNKLAE